MNRCTITLGSEISAVWLTLQQWNLCEIAGYIAGHIRHGKSMTQRSDKHFGNANSDARYLHSLLKRFQKIAMSNC